MRRLLPGQGEHEEPEWVVWLTVAVALALGLLLYFVVAQQSTVAAAGSSTLTHPAGWTKYNEKGSLFAVADSARGGPFATRVVVRQVAQSDILRIKDAQLTDVATAWSFDRKAGLVGYRMLNKSTTRLQGRDAAQIEYAYLMDAPGGAAPGGMPALMRAVDTIIASGDQYYILTFAAEQSEYPRLDAVRQQILDSWRVPS